MNNRVYSNAVKNHVCCQMKLWNTWKTAQHLAIPRTERKPWYDKNFRSSTS